MAVYPTYKVAGVSMDDPSGRWELVDGTRVLPTFPGRRVVNWELPGMVGSQSAAYAPGEAATIPIRLRINAVGSTANTIVNGGSYERMKAIRDNMDMLFYSIGLARQGYDGLVEIRHYTSGSDFRKASGRVVSSAEPEHTAYSDHAYITLLFEIPAGVWGSPTMDVTTATLNGPGVYRIKVPAGTAPSIENMVCLRSPTPIESKWGQRVVVKNAGKVGFSIGVQDKAVTVPANTWIMVNTLHWKYGFTTGSGMNWGIGKPNTGLIEPKGRPTGTALTIAPSPERGYGYVYVTHYQGKMDVIIRSRKMWY